jgi:hypothetical protein
MEQMPATGFAVLALGGFVIGLVGGMAFGALASWVDRVFY